MILGSEFAVGMPNAVEPVFCVTRQGVPAMPQTAADVERVYWVVRTPVKLARLNTLKASQLNCSAVNEILLCRVAGQVFEWQHGDGLNAPRSGSSQKALAPPAYIQAEQHGEHAG